MDKPPQPTISERSELVRFFRWLFSWRTVRRVLIGLAWTATIVALLYAEENWRGRRAWNKYRQELEARGEQLDLKALIPKPVPDEQNFAAVPFVESWLTDRNGKDARWRDSYSWAEAKIISPQKSRSEKGRRQFWDLNAWQMAFAALQGGATNANQKFEAAKPDAASRAKAAPAVLEGLKTSETNLAELRAASSRPYSRYPVVYDMENPWGILLPHLANVKTACVRLQLKTCAELAAGQSEAALEDLNLTLYLADTLKGEPFLISYLVRLACVQIAIQPIWEGLCEHRWSEAQLQGLQKRLQQFHFIEDMRLPLSCEQAAGIRTVDLIKKKGLGLLVDLVSEGSRSDRQLAQFCGFFVPSGWYDQERFNYCRLYQTQLGAIFDETKKRISPGQIRSIAHQLERESSGGRLGKDVSTVLRHRKVASLLLPALENVPRRATTAQTAADQASLACALERCRLANGQFPEQLEALMPQFVAQLPLDALTAQPYKYRRNPDGTFVLYSVGWNEIDDGGVTGAVLFDDREGDWVWESAPGSAP